MLAGLAFKNTHRERRAFNARLGIAILIIVILVGTLIARLAQLQAVQHEYFVTRSDNNRMQVQPVAAVRGLIYDRNGVLLAENVPAYRLELVPEQVPDLAATVAALAARIRIAPHDLDRFWARVKSTPSFHSIPLKLDLDAEEVARIEVSREDFPGVDIRAVLSRTYPQAELTAHLVGYVGGITAADLERVDPERYRAASYIGKTGIERQYESLLHGAPGSKLVEANAVGRRLRELEYTRPAAGKTIYLTIDAELQRVTREAFAQRRGAAVALDIDSGEVLAMVSMPDFNPNPFVNGISHAQYATLTDNPYRPLFHRAIQGQYPPGSTVKPVVALAGFEQHIFSPDQTVFCPGFYQLPDNERKHRDWKRRGHGSMNAHQAIAQSCDVYFYDLAHRLGIDAIHQFLSQFGLGQPTGIDLPNAATGLLPSRDWKRRAKSQVWFPGETLNIGIGQGFMLTTPLQLAIMTAQLASRGQAGQPHLLRQVFDPANGERQQLKARRMPPVPLRDPLQWRRVHAAMVAVIHGANGTGRLVGADAPFQFAGKTGTSQVSGLSQEDDNAPQLEDVPEHLRDHSLFIAYAPADDPRIAIAAIAEHSGSGSAVAAPIVRAMLDQALSRP